MQEILLSLWGAQVDDSTTWLQDGLVLLRGSEELVAHGLRLAVCPTGRIINDHLVSPCSSDAGEAAL